MKTALFVWEFGGHLGHILNMLPLARELSARGFEVAFALHDLARAHLIFENHPQFRLFQAPDWKAVPQDVSGPPQSLPQVLQRHGYRNALAVEGLARAWLSIYHSVQPDLVVYDYAFTAQLAFRDLPAVQVTVGSGFFTPGFDSYSADFWDGLQNNKARLEHDEQAVVKVINTVCAKLGKRPVDFLGDLNRVDANFLCTFPELDHYGERQQFRYVGLLQDDSSFPRVQWRNGGDRQKVFAYLKPGAAASHLLAMLAMEGCEAHVFMPGLPRDYRARFESEWLQFSVKPFDIKHAASTADLVACHGGHGTVATALLWGCPALLLPQQAEQYLMSRRTQALGVSEMIAPDETAATIQPKLRSMLDSTTYRQRATAFADKYSAYREGRPIDELADAVSALLQGKHCT